MAVKTTMSEDCHGYVLASFRGKETDRAVVTRTNKRISA